MLAVVKKVEGYKKKHFLIYSAVGHIVTVEGEKKEYLEELEQIGQIYIDQYRKNLLHGGKICLGDYEGTVEFEMQKPPKWNGRVGKLRTGKYLEKNGKKKYSMVEKLQEQGSFWIFKSGYIYYELNDNVNGKNYVIKDICFAADMHYYYVYNEQNQLVAAIHKPFKNPGEDEFHIYAQNKEIEEGLLFIISYIDFFNYPYDKESTFDQQELHEICMDSAAYQISCDELLQLYDEDFTKRVILNA